MDIRNRGKTFCSPCSS